MSTSIELSEYADDIAALVQDICGSMLSLQDAVRGEAPAPDDIVQAAIYYDGAWNGAMVLYCEEWVACELACRLMRVPILHEFDDDVRDAFGELANIIGGNLKPVLPVGCHISLPAVVEDARLELNTSEVVLRMSFFTDAGPFWIDLLSL